MVRNSIRLFSIVLALSLMFTGCEMKKIGRVDQGRVIAFDEGNNTVTFIRDRSADAAKPDYSFLPPITYKLPTDHAEVGPAPKAGMRMKLDAKDHKVVIYVPTLQNFATINYTLIDQKEDVKANDPLVFDATEGKAKKFPVIDKYRKTISIYSKRQGLLVTFSVPDEYFALPENTWDSGDEVRVYYKQEGVANRFMNISKTDIFKK